MNQSSHRALRGTLAVALLVCLADWTLKAMHPWLEGGWIPHRADRPVIIVLLGALLLCPMIACLIARPLAVWGAGFLLGGVSANMLDLLHNGVVWDMMPIPWDPDRICNLADVFIVAGSGLLIWGLVHTFLVVSRRLEI